MSYIDDLLGEIDEGIEVDIKVIAGNVAISLNPVSDYCDFHSKQMVKNLYNDKFLGPFIEKIKEQFIGRTTNEETMETLEHLAEHFIEEENVQERTKQFVLNNKNMFKVG